MSSLILFYKSENEEKLHFFSFSFDQIKTNFSHLGYLKKSTKNVLLLFSFWQLFFELK